MVGKSMGEGSAFFQWLEKCAFQAGVRGVKPLHFFTSERTRMAEQWTTEQAAELYGLERWGAGYFSVSETGEVVVHPGGNGGVSVSLYEVAQGIQERGFDLPVLVRLSDILDARIKRLHESFAKAISEYNYQGCYRGVYAEAIQKWF